MATCSSIPAWKILWTEEPAKLQSEGSQRGGHDSARMHTCTLWLLWAHPDNPGSSPRLQVS